jgi:hypothetical protein
MHEMGSKKALKKHGGSMNRFVSMTGGVRRICMKREVKKRKKYMADR